MRPGLRSRSGFVSSAASRIGATVALIAAVTATIAVVALRNFGTGVLPSALVAEALVFVQLAAATLISEDLACVGAGALAASGATSYALAATACFVGIFFGDLALFAAGRVFGRRLLDVRFVRRFVKPQDVARSAEWLDRRGSQAILASRFLPGTRLPTYVAAGMLGTSVWRFVGAFAIAAAVWTPALVWLSMRLGEQALRSALAAAGGVTVAVIGGGFAALVVAKAALALARPQSRRLMAARFRRLARWEFWPPWMFYPPVVAYIAWLAVRHRGLTVFTAANPAIPDGGFVGESKSGILSNLTAMPGRVAETTLVRGTLGAEDRLLAARSFIRSRGLSFPVVVKPDVGQRGEGVEVVHTDDRLVATLADRTGDTVVQAFAPGHEFGVFWVRRPGDVRGWIASITEKRFPTVTGDGHSTLGDLIDSDDRAVLMRSAYRASLGDRVSEVPAAGETVKLVEIGSHCRGAVFLDGSWVWTEALERAFGRVAEGFDGFCFGRYDVRVESIEAFQRGQGFTIVELNGVTAEATHIYDPRTRLVDAYRTVFGQWRTAFEIGAANRARGVRPTPAIELARIAIEFLAPGVARRLPFNRFAKRRAECNA